MRRALPIAILWALTPAFVLQAQTIKPEFSLKVHYSETPPGQTADFVIGYDDRATDAWDSSFGEVEMPPFGGPDNSLLNLEYIADSLSWCATKINIMHKPATDSFSLFFKINVRPSDKSVGHLTWDPSQLPSKITGIQATPYPYPTMFLVDLAKETSFDVNVSIQQTDPHSSGVWTPAVITLYYNKPPQFGSASVIPSGTHSSALLTSLTMYPNPLTSRGSLLLLATEPSSVTVTGYDVAGRELLRETRTISTGVNEIELHNLSTPGAVMLHIEATSGSRHEVRNVMVVKD